MSLENISKIGCWIKGHRWAPKEVDSHGVTKKKECIYCRKVVEIGN